MLLPRYLDIRVQRLLEKMGYARVRGDDVLALARRSRLIASQDIDLVIDVGANTGQYALKIRDLGYVGRIHSFEPMQEAWNELLKHMSGDANWSGSQLAMGDRAGTETLHVSSNSVSSSLLDMLPRHLSHAPRSAYVDNEAVRVSRLDDEFPGLHQGASNIWLKLDVQGYEHKVFGGGRETLTCTRIVQVEMSLAALYAGQATFFRLCEFLDGAGFDPIGFEAGFQESDTGVLLQIDGLFRNRSFADTSVKAKIP